MSRFAKVAVSVPVTTLEAVERTRRKLGKTRSAVVTLALEEWLRGLQAGEAARRYVEGYLRQPETVDEIAATDAIAARSTAEWGPWEPGKPSRASEGRAPAPRATRARRR